MKFPPMALLGTCSMKMVSCFRNFVIMWRVFVNALSCAISVLLYMLRNRDHVPAGIEPMTKKKIAAPDRAALARIAAKQVYVRRTDVGLEEMPIAKPPTDEGWLARQLRGTDTPHPEVNLGEPGDYDEAEPPKKPRLLKAVK